MIKYDVFLIMIENYQILSVMLIFCRIFEDPQDPGQPVAPAGKTDHASRGKRTEWSGRTESNRRGQLGKLEHNHFATPARAETNGAPREI